MRCERWPRCWSEDVTWNLSCRITGGDCCGTNWATRRLLTADYETLTVANRILGGASGRLFEHLREQKGYTYGANSGFNSSRIRGSWTASTDVRSEVTDPALTDLIDEIKPLGTESYKKVMLNHGVREPFFGVKIEDLKKIQKRVKKDYRLALDLYASGISDAMYLAGLIADESKMTKKDLERWVEGAYCGLHSEYTVPWVGRRKPIISSASVVFPLPLSPATAVIDGRPSGIENVTLSSAMVVSCLRMKPLW